MKPVGATLHFKAEKKHSVRYDEDLTAAEGRIEPLFRGIYVGKIYLDKPFPETLKITVEDVKEVGKTKAA